MSRADVRTFAWVVPLALALFLGWLFWTDRCLDDEIAKYWPTRSPPVAEVAGKAPVTGDEVVVENPYGIEGITNCCFLTNPDWPFAVGSVVAIVLLIGFLCAWNFQQRAERRAAAISFVAMYLVVSIGQLIYVPGNSEFFEQYGYGTLMHAAIYLLLFASLGGAISWLAAKLTLRWRPRG